MQITVKNAETARPSGFPPKLSMQLRLALNIMEIAI